MRELFAKKPAIAPTIKFSILRPAKFADQKVGEASGHAVADGLTTRVVEIPPVDKRCQIYRPQFRPRLDIVIERLAPPGLLQPDGKSFAKQRRSLNAPTPRIEMT